MTKKLKVVVVGDRESGKSLFANIVASNQTDAQPLAEFARPTGHCRIVEFERQIDSQTVDVEVWDVSGDLGQGESNIKFNNKRTSQFRSVLAGVR